MTSDALKRADTLFANGEIDAARTAYGALDGWHAEFQAAWIDAAFAEPSPETLDKLEAGATSESRQRLLKVLRAVNKPLDDTIKWDIGALRQTERKFHEWEKLAKQARKNRLYGLALKCFEEAEKLEPDMYEDPPSLYQSLPLLLSRHFESLK